uniref:DNA-directed RNA polymerase I subunit RPA34 n=1 Tax=Sciurus vulgaris TaxID=55149 RepID=A0A8D2JQQ6_SCIVU
MLAAVSARCLGLGMAATQPAGAARFSCPPNFTAISPASEARFSLEELSGPDTELWLIQAPANFSPDCLNGRLVPLLGSQTVKGKLAGQRLRYQVLSSSGTLEGEATLLAPSVHAGGGLTCAPAPQGSLRIFEGPQESPSGTPLQPIPASPPPQIPPGLRPRFCAFGGRPPVTGPGSTLALKSPALGKRKKKRQMPEASATQEAVNGYGALEVDTTLGSLEVDVGKKKKKQPVEVMEPVVTEPMAEMLEPLGVLFPSTTKKKRKKPKGAEAVNPQMGMPGPERELVEPELMVQAESPEESALSPSKRKKRRKGAEVELVEGSVVESQPQVKVELQEEAIPLPPRRKKKKEKRQGAVAEPGADAVEPERRPLVLCADRTEPELPGNVGPWAEAALMSKKRKKKEKWQNVMLEPGTEVAEPELPGDTEPQEAPASTKKKKRERGHKRTEPGTEMTEPPQGTMEPELPGEGEPEVSAAPRLTKKQQQWQEGEMPEGLPREEVPVPLLNLESGEVASRGREKKRKRKPQQDPA